MNKNNTQKPNEEKAKNFPLKFLTPYIDIVRQTVISSSSLTLVGLPGTGKSILAREIVSGILSMADIPVIPLWLDLEIPNVDAARELMGAISGIDPTLVKKGWDGVTEGVRELVRKVNQKVLIVVQGAGSLWSGLDDTSHRLFSLSRAFSSTISFLFLLDEEFDDEDSIRKGLGQLYPFVCTNYQHLPLFSEADMSYILELRLKEFAISMNSDMKEKVLLLAGGHVGMMRTLLRVYSRLGQLPSEPEVLLNELDVREVLLRIWMCLNVKTQRAILGLSKPYPDFAVKTGLCNSEGKWFSPLFWKFLSRCDVASCAISQTDARAQMTWQEALLFDLLSQNRGQIIDREQIAQKLWGDDWADKYSDWAIEKLVSKVRKKIGEGGNTRIVTVPKKGFVLE